MGRIVGLKLEEPKKEPTKAEIIEQLKAKGVEFDEKAKKDELMALLEDVEQEV